MAKHPFRRNGGVLVPSSQEAVEALQAVRDGRDVMCELRASRNVRQHKLYFAIGRFVQMNSPRFEGASIQTIHRALKFACGLADDFVDQVTGEVFYVLRSISFEAMPQDEFNPFFENACRVVADRWMPDDTTAESVRREVIAMIDGPHAIGERWAS